MTKKEFLERYELIGDFKTKKEAEKAANAFIVTLEEAFLRGEEVPFIGFGKFEVIERAARMGRHPITGKEIEIEAKKAVRFRVGRILSEKLNK